MLTQNEFQAILSAVSQMIREQRIPVAEHGVAVSGTWSAVDDASIQAEAGTIEVTAGKTAAIIGDDGDTGFAKPRIDVATTAIGDCYAPRGNERTVMIPTETSPIALFIHGSDDIPGNVPPGERWVCHRNAAGQVDSYIKLTNDGATPGDGTGGLLLGFGSLAEIETVGGHAIVANDETKQITITSAGGLTVILDDTTGTIQLAGSGNASGDALVRQSDLQAAINSLIANTNTALSQLAGRVQGGSGVGPSTVSAVTGTGSSITFSG